MLVTINPSVGGVSTDAKTRFFNFLASLHAVATAAAGSTPVVNPVNTSGVKNTSFNCISVISNTQAGGWTAGVSNNITASTAYNASFSSPYVVDLHRPSGKSTYPYYRQAFGNFTYAFSNSSFTSYTNAEFVQGHTNSNPASVAYSSDTNWYNGTWSFSARSSTLAYFTSYFYNYPLDISTASTTYYVAVTELYLIIMQPTGFNYFGIRDVAPWELNRTDNPPWYTFGIRWPIGATFLNTRHHSYQYGWMASISSNNTVGSPGKRGYELLPNATNSYFTALNYHSNSYMANNSGNLFPLSAPFGGVTTAGWRIDSPVTDPVTGLSVPPSYPIIAYYNSGSSACSGRLPGMLKGMSHTAAGLTTFANASEYIVNGQAYQPVLSVSETYPDLFLLLKA